jgi:hypothetical protein
MLSLRATFISTLTQLKVQIGCWQPYSKPTLTPDGNPSITPPGYTAPHRLLGPRMDPSLEMPRSENLHNLPPQNQIIITTPTSLIPSFPPHHLTTYLLPTLLSQQLSSLPPPGIVSTSLIHAPISICHSTNVSLSNTIFRGSRSQISLSGESSG